MKGINTVIIAEDNEKYRSSLIELLKLSFSEAIYEEAGNGHEVLSIIKRQVVDLIILDLNMPEMDGYEVLSELKRRKIRPKIIINSTALSIRLMMDFLKDDYADAYFLKISNIADIVYGVQIISDGGFYICKKLQQKLKDTSLGYLKSDPDLTRYNLSFFEKEILTLICQLMTIEKIAQHFSISIIDALEIQCALIKKIGRKNFVGLIVITVKRGECPVY